MEILNEIIDEFFSKEPYSKLKITRKISLGNLIRALNWAAASELLNAFYELSLDKSLKTPKSTMELAYENYIVEINFLQKLLDSMVKIGILDEASGRYKLRFFKRKLKKPGVVDDLKKTPLVAVFEIIHLMGDDIVDVLMTGKRELEWIKDAAIAFEPLEFSPQLMQYRLLALDLLYRHMHEIFIIEEVSKPKILVLGLASGFGLVNVAQFFKRKGAARIWAFEPSEREAKLAKELLEDFKLSDKVEIEQYDITRSFVQSKPFKQGELKAFDSVITFERWRFFNDTLRKQILTNIAYAMEPFASITDFDITRNKALIFDTLLYTIQGWNGFMNINQRREIFGVTFQRLKERYYRLVLRADLPLVRGYTF